MAKFGLKTPKCAVLGAIIGAALVGNATAIPVTSRLENCNAYPGKAARCSLARKATEDELIGTASVIDGDTLEIHGTRIRLHGIDAPEASQLCMDRNGREYRCGQQAALKLSDYLKRRPVRCVARDIDRYGRIVAVCTVAGHDVNDWLVREGLAVAYRRYSSEYIRSEEAAKAGERGIWQGSFDMPWDWRRNRTRSR